MRRVILAGLSLWLTPVLAAGVFSFGIPFWLAVLGGSGLAVVLAAPASSRLTAAIVPTMAGRPGIAALASLLALAAIVQVAPLSLFMADVNRESCAAARDPFRMRHYCFTAYSEASRLASDDGVNIYQETQYQPRQIGPLNVDTYHYPPPFLLLPTAIRAVAPDFFAQRALWFSVQATLLLFCLLWIVRWVGGGAGAGVLLAMLACLALPQTLIALQSGNFQITAITVSVVALLSLATQPSFAGATALAFVALSKIHPGILALWLLTSRRWRASAWVAGAGVALIALTWLVVGSAPFVDFVSYGVPRISSGEAFPQSERPGIVANNHSFYGLTVRLRTLGVPGLDASTGLHLTSLYGFGVVVLALAAAWRSRFDPGLADDRFRLTVLALALVTLASFRSPFVGGTYGMASTPLVGLLLAAYGRGRERWSWLGGTVALVAIFAWLPPTASPLIAPPAGVIVASAVGIAGALVLNVTAVWRTVARLPGRPT